MKTNELIKQLLNGNHLSNSELVQAENLINKLSTEIKSRKSKAPELTPEAPQVTKYTPSVNYIKYYKYKGILIEITSNKMHKFFSKYDDRYLYFDTAKAAKMYISEFKNILI